jgi:uncharacterized RDD family membrane protein YckC
MEREPRRKDGSGGRRRARPDQAGFIRRGLAFFFDFFAVMAIAVVVFFAFSEIRAAARGGQSEWARLKEALRTNSSVTIGVGKAEFEVGAGGGTPGTRPAAPPIYVIGGRTFDLIYEFLVGYLYFIFCFRWGGRTLGKRLFGLKVVDLEGRPRLGWYQSFERVHGYAASTLAGSLGFLQVLWDREGLTMHDKIAGTTVVRLAKSKTGKKSKP